MMGNPGSKPRGKEAWGPPLHSTPLDSRLGLAALGGSPGAKHRLRLLHLRLTHLPKANSGTGGRLEGFHLLKPPGKNMES